MTGVLIPNGMKAVRMFRGAGTSAEFQFERRGRGLNPSRHVGHRARCKIYFPRPVSVGERKVAAVGSKDRLDRATDDAGQELAGKLEIVAQVGVD